jgi:outer membrane receptor protein involved in Fe transport
MKCLVGFLCVATLSFPIHAQQVTVDSLDLYALSMEQLMSIPITSASKFEQSIKDAPSTISLVTRDQIIKYGWLSANEILYRLPGFSISQDYERKTVSSRGNFEGWNNNHMLMLVDGVPMNDNLYGTAYTWEITPLVFTRSIEVVRGPGSALYGSNATNGVITYNTVSAKDLSGNAEIRYRIGSKGTQVFDVLVGHEGSSVSFVSAFNYYETRGDDYSSHDASGTGQTFSIKDPRSSYYMFNKIEGQGKLAAFSFQHHQQRWEHNTGHGWLFFVPDLPDNNHENRRMLSLRYKTPDNTRKFQQEYVIRYQQHTLNYTTRLFPDNTPGYPNGLTEILKTQTKDVFTRFQWNYALSRQSMLLGGVENTIFFYNGDDIHLSNAHLDSDFSPTANNELVDVGSYLAWLNTHPMINTGFFAQYTSPKIANKLQATVGLRYDYASFKFNTPNVANSKDESRAFDKLSPRLSLVYTANHNWSLKMMAGRAFRTPAPSELFGSNTFLLASNIRNLKPEIVTTFELGSDLKISNGLNWRLNLYRTIFDDQIAYSITNANLSTNLYSLENFGIENELQFAFYQFDGFLNYAYATRLDEEIVDPTIAISKHTLTWVPQHVANIGVKYTVAQYYFSIQSHYQGAVKRRPSDQDAETTNIRGKEVKRWLTFDAKISFKPPEKNIEVGVMGTNLFDEKGFLLKNNLYPFDYRIPGRRILLDIRFMF